MFKFENFVMPTLWTMVTFSLMVLLGVAVYAALIKGSTVWFNDGRPRQEGAEIYNKVTIVVAPGMETEIGFRADGVVVWRKVKEEKAP